MPVIIRSGLTALNQIIKLSTVNQARVGFGITGTWVGTLSFFVSYDGTNYIGGSMGGPLGVQPFPSGAVQLTTTANGTFFADLSGALGVAVQLTALTSGAPSIAIAAANDGSWQDAFLAATSLDVSQSVSGGAVNSQVIAAQANRAWRCRSASIGFSVAPAAAVEFQILDGASSVLFDTYIPKDTPVGQYVVPLPPPDPAVPGSGGVVGTVGNSMTLKLFAPSGSVVSTVNGELHAA